MRWGREAAEIILRIPLLVESRKAEDKLDNQTLCVRVEGVSRDGEVCRVCCGWVCGGWKEWL